LDDGRGGIHGYEDDGQQQNAIGNVHSVHVSKIYQFLQKKTFICNRPEVNK